MFKAKMFKLNKRRRLLILLVCVGGVSGCSTGEWSHDQKSKVLGDCRNEGGTKSYCNCFLEHAIVEFPNPSDFDEIDFETAVNIAEECK